MNAALTGLGYGLEGDLHVLAVIYIGHGFWLSAFSGFVGKMAEFLVHREVAGAQEQVAVRHVFGPYALERLEVGVVNLQELDVLRIIRYDGYGR